MSTILIVDDDQINRLTIKHMLMKADYTVAVAEQGEQALEQLRAGLQPDLILMDIEMPILNGRQALQILKTDAELRNNITVPVIALTAHSLASDKLQIMEDGFDGILCKPIDEGDLLKAMQTYLATKS